MKTEELAYTLPKDRIAQQPMAPREAAKLFAIKRKTGVREHLRVADLAKFITANDCLVLNVTSVLRARLIGELLHNGKEREVFLLKKNGVGAIHESPLQNWNVLIRGSVCEGDIIIFPKNINSKLNAKKVLSEEETFLASNLEHNQLSSEISATVKQVNEDGTFDVSFSCAGDVFDKFVADQGHVPVPPYVHREPGAKEYETVYADPTQRRSAAAPTAGFHLSSELLEELKQKGVQIEKVVLDVGLGTFQPVRAENLEDHKIHAEKIYVDEATAQRINDAKKAGKRIVVVGTTTLRVLESVGNDDGTIRSYVGDTKLFITPGYKFKVVDALLTNFHLPKSSLLALVAAFIGSVDQTLAIYREAVAEEYRFFSFGDAMFVE